jgi:hypothetical protein
MSATKRAPARKSTKLGAAPGRRRASAEDREIAEISARIDQRLAELHAQADEVLRKMSRRGGA